MRTAVSTALEEHVVLIDGEGDCVLRGRSLRDFREHINDDELVLRRTDDLREGARGAGQGLFIVGKVRRSLKRSLKIVRFLADFPTVCKQWND